MTGQELRKIREHKLEMSRRKLCAELDVAEATLYRWERMPMVPKITELAVVGLAMRKTLRKT